MLLAALALAACNAGTGTGVASGVVAIPGCLEPEMTYSLHPTFFSGEGSLSSLHIRMQRGSDLTSNSDGLWLDVADASAIYATLHPPMSMAPPVSVVLPIGDPATMESASMTLYLGQTCSTSFRDVAVVLPSASGTVTFTAIYDPADASSDTAITGHFDDVVFADPTVPDGRHAMLSGSFDFIYNRGRPAQRFP